MNGSSRQRWYLVSEDLKYFREKFNQPSGSIGESTNNNVSAAFLIEFLRYADYVEKEFNYSFIVKKFPQIFLEELVS
jgi:hypothetical protein